MHNFKPYKNSLRAFFFKPKNQPPYIQWGVPNLFLPKILFCCDLKRLAQFPILGQPLLGENYVTQTKERKITPKIVDTTFRCNVQYFFTGYIICVRQTRRRKMKNHIISFLQVHFFYLCNGSYFKIYSDILAKYYIPIQNKK